MECTQAISMRRFSLRFPLSNLNYTNLDLTIWNCSNRNFSISGDLIVWAKLSIIPGSEITLLKLLIWNRRVEIAGVNRSLGRGLGCIFGVSNFSIAWLFAWFNSMVVYTNAREDLWCNTNCNEHATAVMNGLKTTRPRWSFLPLLLQFHLEWIGSVVGSSQVHFSQPECLGSSRAKKVNYV